MDEHTQAIEQMRQMLFQMMARVSVTESVARTAIAMMASFDNSPEMKDKLTQGVFPLLLKEAQERVWPTPQPELQDWLRNQEAVVLQEEFARILESVDAVRATAKRTVN